jgi:hypothetical protein
MKTYFGFAIADSMFPPFATIDKRPLGMGTRNYHDAKREIETAIPILNPSHTATIQAMNDRYGLQVTIPATPPKVALRAGDQVIVMGVQGIISILDPIVKTKILHQ